MRKLAIAAVTAVSSLVITQIASAADMPAKAPLAPLPPVYSWTGFYVGVNLGAHIIDGVDLTGTPADPATVAFWGPWFAAGHCPRAFGFGNDTGVICGVQLGYNWQFTNWVLGLETDFQGSSARADGS